MFLINEENLKIFIYKNDLPIMSISEEEIIFSEKLQKKRKREFLHARSYMRIALSIIFKKKPLEIPLYAPPGLPPILPKEFGYVNISHCNDLLVIGWSTKKIGIDVERIDRKINLDLINKRILTRKEISFLSSIKNSEIRRSFLLEYWVLKESLIKRDGGRLLNNLNKWEWDYNSSQAINLSNKSLYKVKKIHHKEWIIGVSNENLVL